MARQKDMAFGELGERVIIKSMDEMMHVSMLPYAEHVILERALPRVEDGLKPVQRRILYTMLGLGITPDKPHRKSARIVGDCLGKYHPHGDSSVYDAMVRMAQEFNMGMTLVDGHGNFGSVDGDSAAAMRYTEARMTPIALELLRDIEKDTVKFSLNFDDTLKEPDVLPGRFPNLLVNGASGIAVGLATNIPPHNFAESIDAVVAMIDDPAIGLDALMRIMPCPDFPTGGYILESDEIRLAYETGHGRLIVRAKAAIETAKNGKSLIAITELPYQVNKARALEKILKLSQEKKAALSGIADIRDESDRAGMRAVIEIKKDADANKILQYLYKYSDLQQTFGVNMVAISQGKPQQLGLRQLISCYIEHQREVVLRSTRFDLDAAQRREHILSGLMVAILNIDEVIALIRASKTPKAARDGLMEHFKLSEIQAQAILDLRLQRLTNLELIAIEREYKDVQKRIRELKAIIASPKKLMEVIRSDLLEMKQRYAIPRRTKLIRDDQDEAAVSEDDLKVVEDVIVAITEPGRLRRIPKRLYSAAQLDGERVTALIDTATNRRVKLFTNTGACFTLPVDELAEFKAGGRPTNLNSIITLEAGERVVSAFEERESGGLLFYTRNGNVKRTDAGEYVTRMRKVQAIALKGDDALIGVKPEDEESIILVTRRGMSIRFEAASIPPMGRVSLGVKCIKLDEGDEVMYFDQVPEEGEIITITERGYAKRSFVFDYELQGRNGKGLKTFDFKRNGSNGTYIAAAMHVTMPYDLVIEQKHGAKTTVNSEDIPIDVRAGKGALTVMALLDDVVTAAYPLIA